jgi:arylsulfatase A-like enzyme
MRIGLIEGVFFAACAALWAPAQAQNPPDLLFIAVDDLNDWVGVLGGHPQAQTPNIDRLAARGLLFTNAHSPSALCNPSRTALLTGLRPSTSGIYDNDRDWRTVARFAGLPTLPRHFRDNGYRTLGAGKVFHAHTFTAGGFTGYNDQQAWDAFYPSLGRQLPDELGPVARPANGSPDLLGFDWYPLVAEDFATGDGQVVDWIERQLAAETGSPRFVAAGIFRPHLPWYVPQKYVDLYPLDEVELPPVIDDDLADVPEIAREGDFRQTEWHRWIVEAGKWREGVQAYLASVSFADAMVGRVIDALDRSGRADRTIVVLWGDHGFHLGEKERWRKMSLWEESTRVPLIVIAPGITRPGSRTARPVSLMDLYPTLAELTGVTVPAHVEGRSLKPLLEDPNAAWDEPVLTTYGYRNHAVRSERYRYVRYADGSEELYDHRNDPHEWNNLARNPALAEIKQELARHLPAYDAPAPE